MHASRPDKSRPGRLILPFVSKPPLLIDLGLDKLGQVAQRLLPAEVTRLRWDDIGNACLSDVHLGAYGDSLQANRYLDLAGQVGVVELVGVSHTFAGDEFDILPAERMTVACREVPK